MAFLSTPATFIIILLLLLLSAFFSSSETSILSINRYRLKHLVTQKHKGAIRVEKLLQRPDELISMLLIGNNIVNILASVLSADLGHRLSGDLGVAIATGVLTFIVLLFSEIIPKTFAAAYPEKIAFPASFILSPLRTTLLPLIICLNVMSRILLKILGIKEVSMGSNALTPDELKSIVNESAEELHEKDQSMLLSVLDLDKLTVSDVMKPRYEVIGIDINNEWKVILKQLTHSPHGRIILYRDSLDDVIGILRVREAYRLLAENDFDKPYLLRAVDEPYFIPESTTLKQQLIEFQQQKKKLGLVVNEYGDITGLVAVEDILEEIIGEYTTSISPSIQEEVKSLGNGLLLIDGGAHVREINKVYHLDLPITEAKTINGLILEYFESIPAVGEIIVIAKYEFIVQEVEDNRVKWVKIAKR
ncbi:CNNM domain-containing protein [Thorsellia kenyensis]|uniref:CNNM domain-containing protein n=1 Tax=Thorsellia kenyensis TaxID=1549888 RepID=A0ABV6CEJ3_9GAMM